MKLNAQFNDLKDQSVFITGGGSGIGAWLTEGFVAQGAKVAFVQRSDATELCDRLDAEYGNRPKFMACDITDIEALMATIGEARAANGPITVLVNNAASDNRHSLHEFSVEDWDRAININLRPHFFTAQETAKDMRAAGHGSIINFSSISYMMGNEGYPAYVASKSAITGLTRGLARELGKDNIRVNAVMPGWVLTDRQKDLWVTDETLAAHIDRQCLKEEIAPLDIVEPTLFLASSASRMITSQALVVDGGVVFTG
ncbi:SDR family oxidoreductase [Nitratireductor sp. XY-223]|uniref:SDR family NAD(P)-dependent oxidoreductase n=1 Tax=Nitratireductor sp. XY-223 TaxID=2561926 RepID=UPI0010A9EA06|nr:SDR family oxidoreductase [Nitratireductor sp. XY-223]